MTSSPGERSIEARGIINLFIVYIVWGSTYLAIRIAVRPGSGIPPFTLGMVRILIAGILMLLISALRRSPMRPTRKELVVLACSGILLWTGGNGMVNWAEQRIDSSLAALLIATVPLWMVLMESILDRKKPSSGLVLSLIIGFTGIALLSATTLQTGDMGDIVSLLALVLASISWTLGSLLQSRMPVSLSIEVSAGYQQIFGGLGFVVLVLLTGEPRPTPTTEAWLAWGYLIFVGSLIGFTAYVRILQLLPMSVAMTYAYVNPVVALFLGAVILSEHLNLTTLAGAALVLLGVAGVFRDRSRLRPRDGALS
ncbi:MAG: EamA family transporter [Anaerolineales bacterium]|nr:MAG: EamA family transporter [Anaerolineales bacterium]